MDFKNTATGDSIYTRDIVSGLSILEPDVRNKLYRPYADQGVTWLKINDLGYKYAATQEKVAHFEKDSAIGYAKVDTKNSSSGDAAGSTSGTIYVTVDSGENTYIRPKDVITFPKTAPSGAGIKAIVTAVDDDTATTKKLTVTSQASATIPAMSTDDILIITTRVFSEGSDTGKSALSKATEYEHYLQIFKERVSSTGSSLTDKAYVEIPGSWIGTDKAVYYNESLKDGELRMLNHLNGALLFGTKDESVTDSSTDINAEFRTTGGLYEAADERGNDFTYTSSSTIEDWDDVGQLLKKEYISTNVPAWAGLGYDTYTAWENILRDEFNSQDQQHLYNTVNNKIYGGRDLGVSMSYKYITKGHYTYEFETLDELSFAHSYGATDHNYGKTGIIAPMKETYDEMDSDGAKYGTISIRYKKLGAFNREFIMDSLAGFGAADAGEKIVNDTDLRAEMWMAHQGYMFTCANALVQMYDPTT